MSNTASLQLLSANNPTNRRGHSNTVSGPRPPALDTMISRKSHVRRNSEGSPGVPPPGIQVSQPTPLPKKNEEELFPPNDSNRNSSDSTLQIPNTTQQQKKKSQNSNRSRSSSLTSNLLNDIRDNTNKIPLINKIRSRHSADLSENERSSMENSSVNGSVSSVSTKKNNDFHSLFKSVPEEDNLIEDYGCALQKDILLQGRIYVSEKHLCFNANIFGWVTNLVIPFADVKEIEKKSTAIFIPNAIQVTTEDTKYFFASFLSRDTAFELMTDTWRTACPDLVHSKANSSLSYNESDDTSYDSGSYYDSDTEDSFDDEEEYRTVGIADPASQGVDSTTVQKETPATLPSKEAKTDKRRLIFDSPKSSMSLGNNTDAANKVAETAQEVAADATGTKPEDKTAQVHDKTDCNCNSDHYPNVVMDQVYPGTIESIYNIMFKDDFLKTFLTKNQKATEVVIGPWKKDKDADSSREMSYIKPLNNSLGPKSTKCLITEEILFFDLIKSVSVLTTTCTPDVPSGNSFSVKTRTCISYANKGEVRVFVAVLVDFTKSSWLKSTIEKASIDGQVSYYKELDVELRKMLNKSSNNKSGRSERRRRRRARSRSKDPNRNDSRRHSTSHDQQQDTIVHKVLGNASRILADGITAVIDAVCSPRSTHFMVFCLLFMIMANIFIARKMAFIEKQLSTLGESLFNPVQDNMNGNYNKDDDEVWNMIRKMQKEDDTNTIPEDDDSSKWESALATSQVIKERLQKQIDYLNSMLQKAENDIDKVTQAVNDQQQQQQQQIPESV